MRNKLLLLIVVGIVLAGGGVAAWYFGLFTPGPETVIKNAFAAANAGKYQEASQHLPSSLRKQFEKDPEFMRDFWDTLTRDRTIDRIDTDRVEEQTIESGWYFAFAIIYEDYGIVDCQAQIRYVDGHWKFDPYKQFEEMAKEQFESLTLAVSDKFTTVPDSKISLRLPEEMVWYPKQRAYQHSKYTIQFEIKKSPSDSFDSYVKELDKMEQKIQVNSFKFLLNRTESEQNGKRAVMYEVDQTKSSGHSWRMLILVYGDDSEFFVITGTVPKQQNFINAMKESLKTLRWEK